MFSLECIVGHRVVRLRGLYSFVRNSNNGHVIGTNVEKYIE